jgi:methyl-accepting chemotaxis protein
VNKAVMQMDEGTQQNAALVEQAAAASQAIVEQAQALNSVVERYQVGHVETRAKAPKPAASAAPAAPMVERRSKNRPWSNSPNAPAAKAAPAQQAAAVDGGGEWKEF